MPVTAIDPSTDSACVRVFTPADIVGKYGLGAITSFAPGYKITNADDAWADATGGNPGLPMAGNLRGRFIAMQLNDVANACPVLAQDPGNNVGRQYYDDTMVILLVRGPMGFTTMNEAAEAGGVPNLASVLSGGCTPQLYSVTNDNAHITVGLTNTRQLQAVSAPNSTVIEQTVSSGVDLPVGHEIVVLRANASGLGVHCYRNGALIGAYGAAPSVGHFLAPHNRIGNMYGTRQYTAFKNGLVAMAQYNSGALTDATVKAHCQWFADLMGLAEPTSLVTVFGDSIDAGQGTAGCESWVGVLEAMLRPYGVQVNAYGAPSAQAAHVADTTAYAGLGTVTRRSLLFNQARVTAGRSDYVKKIAILGFGWNDYLNGRTYTQCKTDLETIAGYARADGYPIVLWREPHSQATGGNAGQAETFRLNLTAAISASTVFNGVIPAPPIMVSTAAVTATVIEAARQTPSQLMNATWNLDGSRGSGVGGDGLHPGVVGHREIAHAAFNSRALRNALGLPQAGGNFLRNSIMTTPSRWP
jgi:lysophospholipase L1-like esterase